MLLGRSGLWGLALPSSVGAVATVLLLRLSTHRTAAYCFVQELIPHEEHSSLPLISIFILKEFPYALVRITENGWYYPNP